MLRLVYYCTYKTRSTKHETLSTNGTVHAHSIKRNACVPRTFAVGDVDIPGMGKLEKDPWWGRRVPTRHPFFSIFPSFDIYVVDRGRWDWRFVRNPGARTARTDRLDPGTTRPSIGLQLFQVVHGIGMSALWGNSRSVTYRSAGRKNC